MNMRQILLVGSAVTILSSAALGHAQEASHKSVPAVTAMASTATMASMAEMVTSELPQTGQVTSSKLAQPRALEKLDMTSSSAAPAAPVVNRAVKSNAPVTGRATAVHATAVQAAATARATQSAKAQLPAHASVPAKTTPSTISAQTSRQTADLYWLARAVEAEAAGESMAVKIAVADVILNRVRSSLYPNSVQQVIFQQVNGHYAFTSVANGWIYHQPSIASVNAAREALLAGKNIVPSALVFYNSSQTPAQSWVRTRPVISTLGSLTFAQ